MVTKSLLIRKNKKLVNLHCVKRVSIWKFSDLHFLVFGFNTENYSVNRRILSECEKIPK